MNGLPKPCYVMSEPHLSGYRVVLGYETLTEAQDAQSALAASPPAREEAPAEGAGEVQRRVEKIVFEDFYGSPVAGSKERLASALIREFGLSALRNRTSEPEAGAVAWRWRYDDEGLTNWSYGPYSPSNKGNQRGIMEPCEVQPIYTHPAPATADKLKEAKEALEPFAALADKFTGPVVEVCDPHPDNPSRNIQPLFTIHLERAFQALAALNEQPQ